MLIIGQDAIKTWYTCREQGAPAHAPMQVQHVPHSTHISFSKTCSSNKELMRIFTHLQRVHRSDRPKQQPVDLAFPAWREPSHI